MKVADSVETRGRQYAAAVQLRDILGVLTWDHLFVRGGGSGLNPEEASLNRGYLDAENRLNYGSALVPGLSVLIERYSARSSPFRSFEILDRYFSPEWKAAFLKLDTQYRVRVLNEPPAVVQAEQWAPPATVPPEQRAQYFANMRCTSGATGANGKSVAGLEKEACDMAMAEIGEHWGKLPDGWITLLVENPGDAPTVFMRQVRSLAVERVKTRDLTAADSLNGFEWAGEVGFTMGPMREEGNQGLVSGSTSVMRGSGFWSQWVDYRPLPLQMQRVKGKWSWDRNNSLVQGMIPRAAAPSRAPGVRAATR
jgi:hypothetical protein